MNSKKLLKVELFIDKVLRKIISIKDSFKYRARREVSGRIYINLV